MDKYANRRRTKPPAGAVEIGSLVSVTGWGYRRLVRHAALGRIPAVWARPETGGRFRWWVLPADADRFIASLAPPAGMLTLPHLAALLGVREHTLWSWTERKQLPARWSRHHRRNLVERGELYRWLEDHRQLLHDARVWASPALRAAWKDCPECGYRRHSHA